MQFEVLKTCSFLSANVNNNKKSKGVLGKMRLAAVLVASIVAIVLNPLLLRVLHVEEKMIRYVIHFKG